VCAGAGYVLSAGAVQRIVEKGLTTTTRQENPPCFLPHPTGQEIKVMRMVLSGNLTHLSVRMSLYKGVK
jgi:hypothetical protein